MKALGRSPALWSSSHSAALGLQDVTLAKNREQLARDLVFLALPAREPLLPLGPPRLRNAGRLEGWGGAPSLASLSWRGWMFLSSQGLSSQGGQLALVQVRLCLEICKPWGRVVFRAAELVILRHCGVVLAQFVVSEVVACCVVLRVVQLPLWPLADRAASVHGEVLNAISSIGEEWD